MKRSNIWNGMSVWLRAFLILALIFLVLGLGTLGSVRSTGDACLLSYQQDSGGNYAGIVLNVTVPEGAADDGDVHRDLYVKEIYLNVGAVYTDLGDVVTLRVARSSDTNSWYNSTDIKFAALYEEVEEGKEPVGAFTELYNWVKFDIPSNTSSSDGWPVSYSYYKLTVPTANASILLNEIVFVANDRDLTAEGAHEPVVLSAAVYDKTTGSGSVLPYGERANAVIDSPCIPSLSQSSFFRFGQEEMYSLMTISEMRLGATYAEGGVYHIDTVYNTLGNDLLALGTLIGGMSPFGLRLMPFLASFGILVFGFLFVRELTGNEKAGFVFSVLYALCGVSIGFGHLGTPLTIGLFFFTAALYFTMRSYRRGVEKTQYRSAAPMLLAGLFAAASLCVNGAFIIPVCGLIALFVLGLVRQIRTTRAALDVAIGEVEADEAAGGTPHTEEGTSEPRKKLAKALAEHRFKGSVAGCAFFGAFVLGFVLISVLAMLPMYYPYVKMYDDPAPDAATRSIFFFFWKAFSGGFAGGNLLFPAQSAWAPFYLLFKGTGEHAAATAVGSLVAVAALVSGVAGAVLAVLLLVRKIDGERFKEELIDVLIPLVGLVLGLVTAALTNGGQAFQLLAYLCLFAIAAKAASEEDEKYAKVVRILTNVCLMALAVCFGLFAATTFSIPTSFLSGLWA